MEKKDLTKLTESMDMVNLTEDCIVLSDENADDLYGGWWGGPSYYNCSFYNCSHQW